MSSERVVVVVSFMYLPRGVWESVFDARGRFQIGEFEDVTGCLYVTKITSLSLELCGGLF